MSESNENTNFEEKNLDDLDVKDLLSLVDVNNLSQSTEIGKEGFRTLLSGYVDYARELLENRALPDLRDGLKPVQRFGLWILYNNDKVKKGKFQKSSVVSSAILNYHPHNQDSAYESLVNMVDSTESTSVPLLEGDGSFGKAYSSSPPAADRYTSMRLNSIAKKMFESLDGVKQVPSFDGELMSPEALPTPFPYVLTKNTEGIGVGFATNILACNINDVADLVSEYINDGHCHTKIIPDFATGGYIVPTERELEKLMKTGRGRFVVRGRVEVDGKNIKVVEVPTGTTLEKIKSEIIKADIKGIVGEPSYLSDINGCDLTIKCSSKAVVESVLADLYVKTPLQKTVSSNLATIESKKLVLTGVWGIVERWVKWRRGVLETQFAKELEILKEKVAPLEAFIKLVNTEGLKEEVIELVTKESDETAIQFIIDNLGCDRDIASWIINRRLNQFRNGSKYVAQLDKVNKDIDYVQTNLNNVDNIILRDMANVKAEIGSKTPRRTEITNTVYKNLEDVKDSKQEAVYPCYYELKNGFIKKVGSVSEREDSIALQGYTNSVIIALSSKGEIFRIYGDDLEFTSYSALGTFIPTYSGLTNNKDVEILWATVCDGDKYVLTYLDGFLGFLDTSEFLEGTIKSRYMRNGISEHAEVLVDVRLYKPNSAILVLSSDQKYALAYLDSVKQKSRTARTRVFNAENIIDSYVLPLSELKQRIPNSSKLLSKKPVAYDGKLNIDGQLEETVV